MTWGFAKLQQLFKPQFSDIIIKNNISKKKLLKKSVSLPKNFVLLV